MRASWILTAVHFDVIGSDMKTARRRSYRMGGRAAAAARTATAVRRATAALWRERSLDEITLGAIAERAGVSVRTVIRRFGSRAGVIAACIGSDAAGIRAERAQAPVGDV